MAHTTRKQTCLDDFLQKIKRKSKNDSEILRKDLTNKKIPPSIGIKKHFKAIKTVGSFDINKNTFKTRKRNWDSSSDEEFPTLSTKRLKVDKNCNLKDKNPREIIEFFKQQSKCRTNNDLILSKNCYSGDFCKKLNFTVPEINSMPITIKEKQTVEKKTDFDEFINEIIQKINHKDTSKLDNLTGVSNIPVIENMSENQKPNLESVLKSFKKPNDYTLKINRNILSSSESDVSQISNDIPTEQKEITNRQREIGELGKIDNHVNTPSTHDKPTKIKNILNTLKKFNGHSQTCKTKNCLPIKENIPNSETNSNVTKTNEFNRSQQLENIINIIKNTKSKSQINTQKYQSEYSELNKSDTFRENSIINTLGKICNKSIVENICNDPQQDDSLKINILSEDKDTIKKSDTQIQKVNDIKSKKDVTAFNELIAKVYTNKTKNLVNLIKKPQLKIQINHQEYSELNKSDASIDNIENSFNLDNNLGNYSTQQKQSTKINILSQDNEIKNSNIIINKDVQNLSDIALINHKFTPIIDKYKQIENNLNTLKKIIEKSQMCKTLMEGNNENSDKITKNSLTQKPKMTNVFNRSKKLESIVKKDFKFDTSLEDNIENSSSLENKKKSLATNTTHIIDESTFENLSNKKVGPQNNHFLKILSKEINPSTEKDIHITQITQEITPSKINTTSLQNNLDSKSNILDKLKKHQKRPIETQNTKDEIKKLIEIGGNKSEFNTQNDGASKTKIFNESERLESVLNLIKKINTKSQISQTHLPTDQNRFVENNIPNKELNVKSVREKLSSENETLQKCNPFKLYILNQTCTSDIPVGNISSQKNIVPKLEKPKNQNTKDEIATFIDRNKTKNCTSLGVENMNHKNKCSQNDNVSKTNILNESERLVSVLNLIQKMNTKSQLLSSQNLFIGNNIKSNDIKQGINSEFSKLKPAKRTILENFPNDLIDKESEKNNIKSNASGRQHSSHVEDKFNDDTSIILSHTEHLNLTNVNIMTQNKNRSKEPIKNLLNDEILNSILTEEYKKHNKKEEVKNSLTHGDKIKRLEKLSLQHKFKKGNNGMNIKRYRKGKLKIYRLNKLKKASTSAPKEDLNIENVLSQLTQNFIESDSKMSRTQSGSSVSTSSSYITDETRSETLSLGSRELSKPQKTLRTGLDCLLKDKTLFCKKEERVFSDCDKSEIKMKIQNIFLQVFDDLTNGRRSVLKFRRQCLENCTFKDGRLQLKSENAATTSISSNAPKSQVRFKLILFVMKKIQTLLETNTKLTKRELFYQMKDMISNQVVIDRAINTVSCLLDVGMWALNIVAQKGLVYGDLKILLTNGETINCKVPGTLIPQDIGEIVELQSMAYFILVVEKESIFHKLIEEDLPSKLTRPFIMITGKGFPDLNTQLFLRKLWVIMSIPVFILVDADPHGIQIMLNYRYGSINNAHVSHHLAVPNAKWLGIYPSEIKDIDITTQPLTERELKLVQHLLKTPYMENNPAFVLELNVMLENRCKAGIESLIKSQIFLSEVYLPMKFYRHKFI